jgi:hypothetical protein
MIRLSALLALLGLALLASAADAQYCAAPRTTYAAPSYVQQAVPYQPQATYTYSTYYQALAIPAYSVTYAPDNAAAELAKVKTDLAIQKQATELREVQLQLLQLRQQQPPPPDVPESAPQYVPQQPYPQQLPPQSLPPGQRQPKPKMPPAEVPTSFLQPGYSRQACAACHDGTTKAKGGGLALFHNGQPHMTPAQQAASIKAVMDGRMPLRSKLTTEQRLQIVRELGVVRVASSQ